MRKVTALILLLVISTALSSCTNKNITITSSSRYVTPMMIQQIEKKLNQQQSSAKEGTDTDILKADILSAFKRVGKEDSQSTSSGEILAENTQTVPEDKPQEISKQTSTKENVGAVAENETVYVSKTGKKFHKTPTCSNMKSAVEMTRKEAENSGRTYCKKCYE